MKRRSGKGGEDEAAAKPAAKPVVGKKKGTIAPPATSLGRRMAAGALGSCTAEAGTLWLDTCKVRLQVAPKGAPTSLVGMLLFVLRNEGVAGLYGGLTPALARQASYQSVKMGTFEPIRDSIAGVVGVPETEVVPFWILALAGGLAGSIGTVLATPTEIAKVRLQAGASGGVVGTLQQLHSEVGLAGMWLHPSVIPNVQRSFVVNAAELAAYEYTKNLLVKRFKMPETILVHTAASIASGLMAALASTPVDMAKTRMMNGDCGASMVHCLAEVVNEFGVMALYASFFATWMRLAPWNVLNFVSLEKYKRLFAHLDIL